MISVVCPVYNEEKYIGKVLEFFTTAAPSEKELFIVDGGSTDRTRDIVNEWSSRFPGIHLLDNPSKFVPFALNQAIPRCQGDIIVRLDAHTEYEADYFTSILDVFKQTNADIVGGPMRARGTTAFQKAVAYCTSTRLGIGDSGFHMEEKEGWVESVYLGAWRSSIFAVTGLFDEQMSRNQDDEFHYRARSKGMRIYLSPRIRSYYFPRSTPASLGKQYFQYGLFKPLVLKKVRSGIRSRHLIPSAFVMYLLSIPVLLTCTSGFILLPGLLYLLLDLLFSIRSVSGFSELISRMSIYPILHLTYGTGFLCGLGKRTKPRS